MGSRKWATFAVVVASTAALLGTSDETSDVVDTSHETTYTFQRKGIQGGSVELTSDQARVTFYVNIHVDDLGPDGALSSDGATALVRGTTMGVDFEPGVATPAVNFKLSTPGNPSSSNSPIFTTYQQGVPLSFTGNCAKPMEGAACRTSFALELSRIDDGTFPGVVRVDWSFDVSSRAVVIGNSTETSTIGPSDPPWTIEVTR